MATQRIVYDSFRVLLGNFGRMSKKEFNHKMYFDFFEWPLTVVLLCGVSPLLWAGNEYLKPKGEDYHRYFKKYTISRAKEPG